MKPLAKGAFFIAILCVTGCATPMTARQAQIRANGALNRYCEDSGPCGPRKFTQAQRLKQGWLVEFDSGPAKYGVFVHDNRQTDVSVWTPR